MIALFIPLAVMLAIYAVLELVIGPFLAFVQERL